MNDIKRYFSDPRIRAALFERLTDDELRTLAESVDPVEITPEEITAAREELFRRVERAALATRDPLRARWRERCAGMKAAVGRLVLFPRDLAVQLITEGLDAVRDFGRPAACTRADATTLLPVTMGAELELEDLGAGVRVNAVGQDVLLYPVWRGGTLDVHVLGWPQRFPPPLLRLTGGPEEVDRVVDTRPGGAGLLSARFPRLLPGEYELELEPLSQ